MERPNTSTNPNYWWVHLYYSSHTEGSKIMLNHIIGKAKERHIFLFELYLVFAKEVKDTNGKAKYIYKSKLLVSF